MTMLPMKKLGAALVATAALGAGAGLGMSQAGGDDPPPAWAPATTDAAVPATADQKEAYSVLTGTQRTEDTANAQLETLAARSDVGFDATGARVVGSTAAGPIWLVPANGGLCLALEDTADGSVGAACEASTDVIARGTTIGDGTTIYGIVPDGTTTVTVTPAGGSTTAVPFSPGGIYTLPFASATVGVDGPVGHTEFHVLG
jgi:hypothetical protein